MGSNISQPATYDAPAYGCLITFLVLDTIAVTARGASRSIQKVSFWLDDALAYLAYMFIGAVFFVVRIGRIEASDPARIAVDPLDPNLPDGPDTISSDIQSDQ
ncbi:MAG: hypothetical protein M1820_003626 [Bogoriella megaspora]|nr:MAG: hypothetical protein M1820_003626 [Bogoriella megaspora]